ncbi:MAG: Gfo/Idh/MocA family oxidoreductase [candidate division KSB1 bacterium]|nr:Gfo/Idh/MocA family oxidoreductase [candidate division KSB1 bacterium]MDZ7318044.1 Gfo/Idh/MocA family oxidoreductase [candidate division KSB1 bacterium]MDZ7341324.1 Gfo/Idh/MocA family oxidoreductase [candidate division KSB1 bacterium]
MQTIRIGVIGCGYWGPNLIRNFQALPNCQMKVCCDLDTNRLHRMQQLYPSIRTTVDYHEWLESDEIDAVAIATPVRTHLQIARDCLAANKHILIEKPITASVKECSELIRLANAQGKILMVGHTFEYTASVNKMAEIIDSNELGDILYIAAERLNLGLFQRDINVIWDLAPHDISIILYLLKRMPLSVNARGSAHYRKNIEDVAWVSLDFGDNLVAFLHHSWLDPYKIRRMTIVGSKKMLVYNDIDPNEKIKIFDKGIKTPPYYNTFAEFHFAYRYGDIHSPRIEEYEPLARECQHFIDCIINNQRPVSDGYDGLKVVSILEAASKSLKNSGESVAINLPEIN